MDELKSYFKIYKKQIPIHDWKVWLQITKILFEYKGIQPKMPCFRVCEDPSGFSHSSGLSWFS